MALSIGTKIPSQISESATVLTEFDLGYYGWRVVLAACLGVMAGFGSLFVYTFVVFVKPLGAEFHWNRESISLGFGLAAISLGLISPLLGRLIDRFGPRLIILPCMTVFGCAIASLALLRSQLWQLYVTCILIGLVGNGAALIGVRAGGEAASTPYLLTRYFGLRAFSTLYGLTWTFYAAAGAIGPVILGRAFDSTGSYTSLLVLLAGVFILGSCYEPVASALFKVISIEFSLNQNSSFRASWTMRPGCASVMEPKFGELMSLFGRTKFTLLKMLKNSARNCRFTFS